MVFRGLPQGQEFISRPPLEGSKVLHLRVNLAVRVYLPAAIRAYAGRGWHG
jgi:hypothetical protein